MRKVIILLAALVMLFGLTACGGTEIIEEQPVETAYIDTIYYSNTPDLEGYDEFNELTEILDVMENSEAQFFYIDYIEPEASGSYFEIYQTDKATFDEKVGNAPKSDKASKTLTSGFNCFFNLEYDNMHDDVNEDTNTWFKDVQIDIDTVAWSGYYIRDNKIKLSCEDVTPLKLGVMHYDTTTEDPNGDPCVEQNAYYYFFIGTADVTTVEKESDPMGYFAETGETKTITIKSFLDSNDLTKSFWVEGLFLE